MIYVAIQTIQMLGRRVLIKVSLLTTGLILSGLFQVLPILLILPIIRVIARPNKQGEGLPRRMRHLFPEDLANTLDQLIITTETKTLIVSVMLAALSLFSIQFLINRYTRKYLDSFLLKQNFILANKLFNNYLKQDIFSYANPIRQIESGCRALSSMLNNIINSLVSIIMFLMLASILIFIYPLPGLASIVITVITTITMAFIIRPKMEQRMLQIDETLRKEDRTLQDNIKAIKEIKLMGRERFFLNNYIKSQFQKQDQQKIRQKYQTILTTISMFMRYAGLGSGVVLAIYTLPKEALAGFVMLFILLSTRTTTYAQTLTSTITAIYQSLLVLKLHYKTLLKYDKKSATFSSTPITCNENIQFKDIYFRHENKTDDDDENYEMKAQEEKEEEEEEKLPFVLEDLNFNIKQGQFIGLVGRNGSGKSTILDLFTGLLIPTKGSMLIDGKQLNVSDRKIWRQQISYIIQKPHMVSNTILYNITLGLTDEEIEPKLLKRALELSMLDQVIAQLPKGIQTPVGIMGSKVSGGQAQRIALARALYQNRPILLLDEATRSIDAATEVEIMNKISTMRGEKTVIIVTHRVQSLKPCDKIFLVDNKKIAASGDYDTLCEMSPLFRLFALGELESKKETHDLRKVPSVA